MLSLHPDRFEEPAFKALSDNGQAVLRAEWDFMQAIPEDMPTSFDPKSGLPIKDEWPESVREASDAWERARKRMTEDEWTELSAYAHRCDYPDECRKSCHECEPGYTALTMSHASGLCDAHEIKRLRKELRLTRTQRDTARQVATSRGHRLRRLGYTVYDAGWEGEEPWGDD